MSITDAWEAISPVFNFPLRIMQSPIFGQLYGQGLSQREQEEWDRYRKQQQNIAASVLGRIGEFGRWSEGLAGDISAQGLGLSQDYYGGLAPQQRFAAYADPLRGLLAERLGAAETAFGDIGADYAGLEQRGIEGAGELVRQQQALGGSLMDMQSTRQQSLMDMLHGAGQQERQDIRRAYQAERGTQAARLGQLGLAGSSAATSAAAGLTARQSESLGRLEERLRHERLGLAGMLGAERLGLAQQLGAQEMGLRGAGLELELGLGQQRLGAASGIAQYLAGLRGEQVGMLGQLGAAGLSYQDAAMANLLASQEHYGMMPYDIRQQNLERYLQTMLQDIQWAPPYPTGGAQLQYASTQRG